MSDKVVVITGGASGIGRALAEACHEAGAKGIAIIDRNAEAAADVAKSVRGIAINANVGREFELVAAIRETEAQLGPIDLYCSNAGIGVSDAPDWMATSADNDDWQRCWDINVMAHVYAARALLPAMIDQGSGFFLITASAAGLLSQIGDAPYSVTKHAAIGFAESLAITHGDDGIGVSVLCPQAVDTAMIRGLKPGAQSVDGVLSPETVAAMALQGIAEQRFLITPHPTALDYYRKKAADYDRWIGGMRSLRRTLIAKQGTPL